MVGGRDQAGSACATPAMLRAVVATIAPIIQGSGRRRAWKRSPPPVPIARAVRTGRIASQREAALTGRDRPCR